MARTKRTRRYYKKGRWSANIQELNNQAITASVGNWAGTTTLATNPVQNTLGVSQVYTVKNLEINFTLDESDLNQAYVEAVTCYIMYVPQGMNVDENYHLEHPEYILTYKFLGSPTVEYPANQTQNYQPFKVKTRMARRLQTGDSIVLFVKGFNKSDSNITIRISGVIRWWTKAN